jgi:hypothetical protein
MVQMALSSFQKRVLNLIAGNRSETSYIAGGAVLNRDWPRRSEDLDVFHDTDEEIGATAEKDIATLRAAGLIVNVDILIYGLVEATVADGRASTIIQWMSETRWRFFPLVRDAEWGARLHDADLAVNKVIASSSRSKARDAADLYAIVERYAPLLPLVVAAAGKPPYFAPTRAVEEMRRRVNGLQNEEFVELLGLPVDWTAERIRERLRRALDEAEAALPFIPPQFVGCLAVDSQDRPASGAFDPGGTIHQLRRATATPEVFPVLKDGGSPFL